MVTLKKEEYTLLKNLQNNHQSRLVRIPSDEPMIDIDLNSRAIILPVEFQDFLSIEKDHRAETVYFRCDRFFEDVDLAKTMIVVEYINALGEGRLYPVMLKDIESQEGKIIFDWCIGGEATKAAGTIQFAVRFYSVDQERAIFTYNLNTVPVTSTIAAGMADISTDENYDYAIETLENIWAQIDELKRFQVHWNDLN